MHFEPAYLAATGEHLEAAVRRAVEIEGGEPGAPLRSPSREGGRCSRRDGQRPPERHRARIEPCSDSSFDSGRSEHDRGGEPGRGCRHRGEPRHAPASGQKEHRYGGLTERQRHPADSQTGQEMRPRSHSGEQEALREGRGPQPLRRDKKNHGSRRPCTRCESSRHHGRSRNVRHQEHRHYDGRHDGLGAPVLPVRTPVLIVPA